MIRLAGDKQAWHAGWVTSQLWSQWSNPCQWWWSVRLWSVQDGTCFKLLQGHSSCVWEVAFNPAGQTLASGSADRSARLWNVQGGTCLKTFQGRTNGVRSVSFRSGWLHWPVAVTMPSCGSGIGSKKLASKALPGHTSWIWAVAFHPNGQMVW